MKVQCGYWADEWADNTVSIWWEESTGLYMMEYHLPDSGVRGREVYSQRMFDAIMAKYHMEKMM